MNKEIEILVFKAYHGELTQAEQAILSEWVAASPEHARQVIEYSADTCSIEKALQNSYPVNTTSANEIVKLNEQPKRLFDPAGTLYSVRRVVAALLVVTTIVGLTLWARWDSQNPAELATTGPDGVGLPAELVEKLPTDVYITESKDWVRTYYTSEPEKSGTLTIPPFGFVHYEFEGDGFILLEGPATYQLENDYTIHLIEGRLVAKAAKDSSEPLTILIDDTELTVREAEFGVQNFRDNVASAVVFEGSVEVRQNPSDGQPPVSKIEAGQIGSLDTRAGKVEKVARATQAEAIRYSRSAEFIKFRPSHWANTVQYLTDAPASLMAGELADGSKVWLFCERAAVSVNSSELPVFPDRPENLGDVPGDELLDSYLLHFDPQVSDSDDNSWVTGIVKFDRPIRGVLGTAGAIRATDAFFGSANTAYPRTSGATDGLDNADSSGIEFDIDGIKLGKDGKTLYFRFLADKELDQVRILVEGRSQRRPLDGGKSKTDSGSF